MAVLYVTLAVCMKYSVIAKRMETRNGKHNERYLLTYHDKFMFISMPIQLVQTPTSLYFSNQSITVRTKKQECWRTG
jgi:hypothetical protein